MQDQKLWTKNYVAITIIFFINGVIFFLLMSTVGIFVSGKFNVPASIAGLTASIFIISSSFSRIGTGRALTNHDGKKILFFGMALCLATNVLYFFVNNVTTLILVRFLHGISSGIASTAAGTMIAYVIPLGRRAEGIGNFMSSGMLASAVGPYIGITLMKGGSLTPIYLLCLILGIASIAFGFMINMPKNQAAVNYITKTKMKINDMKFDDFFEKRTLPISILIFLTCISYSSIMTYLPMYSKAINMASIASVYFIFHAAGAIFTRPFMGRLMDSRGANIVSYPVLIVFAIGMFIVSRAESSFIMLLGAAFIGFGFGNMNSIGQTIAIRNIPANRIGMATSTFYIFMDMGLGVGPYILGVLIPVVSFRGIYIIASILLAVCIGVYYLVHGAKESSEKKLSIQQTET